jgi:molybdate transport system substrate-binding protein
MTTIRLSFLLATLSLSSPLLADELTVLAAGASKPAAAALFAQFEKDTGHRITAQFIPMGKILELLGKGDSPDLIIVSQEVAEGLQKDHKLRPEATRSLIKTGIGMAVKQGTPVPVVATTEDFKNALLNAKSIVMVNPNTGTSGKHLSQVYQQLGIAAAIASKTKYVDGGYALEPVAKGEIELGLQQMTEILAVAGLSITGPLPESVQKWTVYQTAMLAKASKTPALQLQAFLHAPAQTGAWQAKGFLQP